MSKRPIAVAFVMVNFCALVWLTAPTASLAFSAPGEPPAPDFDARGAVQHALPAAAAPQPGPMQKNALDALQNRVKGLTVRWSALTEAPSRVYSTTQPLTEPSAAAAAEVATDFLTRNRALFNLSAQDLSETRYARNAVSPHNGVTHLTIQQQVNGLDVFGGTIDINVNRDGQVLNVACEAMPRIHGSANQPTPGLSSDEAIDRAVASAGVTAVRNTQVAGLLYFPVTLERARLAWDVTVEDAATPNVYRSLVDAGDGTVLWRTNLTKYQIATHGAVFDGDSPIPNNPIGTSTGTVARVDRLFHGGGQEFPRTLGTPLFPQGDVHFDWWAGAVRTVTTGNNVQAQEDRNGDNADGTQATATNDDFTQPLDLTMDPSTYTAAAIVNLFYWNNRAHDIWYRYGFTEAFGNMQSNNFGLGGSGGDPQIADAQDNRDGNPASFCNANNTTPGDGTSPRMQMYQCNNSTPERDGDFSSGTILHEYHHPMAERLRPTLHSNAPQGGGMGEGGGDFEDIAVLAKPGDDPNGSYGHSQYQTNNANGNRRSPYSIRPGVYPFTYASIGTASSEVHDVGEIWCNTLWIARALLVSRYGFVTGTDTVLQLQLDGYKMAPSNPDFLDMRDAILSADLADNGGINQCLLWEAFARMGIGASASSTGPTDSNPVEAFDTPLECTPKISVNPSSLDFGLVPVNPVDSESGVKSLDFNVCNVGNADLFVTDVVLQTANPAFTIIAPPPGGFPLPLSADFCHTIEVRCNPGAAGVTSATVQIESSDPLNPKITPVTLACTGAVPAIQVSPDPLSFGNVPVDASGGQQDYKDLTVQVRNTGTSDLSVAGIAAVGGDAADFTLLTPVPGFPTIISPDAEFDFTIRFNPSAAGPRSTTLQVTSNTGGVAGTVTSIGADGVGTVPTLKITGSTDFGDVCAGVQAEKTISVCNTGLSNLAVTGAGFDPACADFTLINNPFPATVSPDSCLDLTIRFTPTSGGPKTCTLVITSNDPSMPSTSLVVTANTPAPAIDVPPDQGFPPTVIQSVGACESPLPFPVSNTGSCNLNITNVAIGGTDGSNYSLSGLPSFPIILQPGHVAGEGNLDTVFMPTALDRDRLGTVTVTYESDPITHATTDVTRALCGEGVRTGARVLVRAGGVPLATVEKIQLQRINANRNKSLLDTNDVAQNVTLQTVTPAAPCPPFQFHREYGTVSNPIQLLPGSYQVTAAAIVNGKRMSKTVGFSVDTCGFNPTITIDF